MLQRRNEELRALNTEIAERTDYKNQQEDLINQMVEAGNAELKTLQYNILLAKQELKEIKVQIRNHYEEYGLITEETFVVQAEITRFNLLPRQFGSDTMV